jgi:hypothetical protein
MNGSYLTNTQNNKVAWVQGDIDQESSCASAGMNLVLLQA